MLHERSAWSANDLDVKSKNEHLLRTNEHKKDRYIDNYYQILYLQPIDYASVPQSVDIPFQSLFFFNI